MLIGCGLPQALRVLVLLPRAHKLVYRDTCKTLVARYVVNQLQLQLQSQPQAERVEQGVC
ncbi:MAG: hypothetical protein A2Y38_16700 [Spirochaetes bacterium GWB1_59_5]|nr:MAG: hypothetical protein A2Y38_16700 [Spirochaetes bacterium GWB1_59_5]